MLWEHVLLHGNVLLIFYDTVCDFGSYCDKWIHICSCIALLGGTSPESSPKHSDQLEPLELSAERLHVLECLTILTRSVHNCRVFSYYGGVQKVTSLLKGSISLQMLVHSENYLWVLDICSDYLFYVQV